MTALDDRRRLRIMNALTRAREDTRTAVELIDRDPVHLALPLTSLAQALLSLNVALTDLFAAVDGFPGKDEL